MFDRQRLYIELSTTGSQVSVTNTATDLKALMKAGDATLTDDFFASISHVDLNAEADVRYLYGGTPTTSVGMVIKADETKQLSGVDVAKLKLIRVGGADVKVNVQVAKLSRVY